MITNVQSVCIAHEGVCVSFYSTNGKEIDAIKTCFGYFWDIGEPPNVVEKWSVVSHKVSSVQEIIDIYDLTRSAGLFKSEAVKKAIIDNNHYYLHKIQNVACVTCFDLGDRTTHFYHENEVTEYGYIRNLVREAITARYIFSGHLLMHASACSINGAGIMMPGLKGAGKSTLLSHLLEGGASYIGNDAVLCKVEGNSVILTSYPQCVRLSRQTILSNKRMSRYINSNADQHEFINGKVEFLPGLFDSMHAMHKLSFITTLKLIIIPSIDLARDDYSLEIGDNDVDLLLLRDSMFHRYHSYVWSPFFEALNDPEAGMRMAEIVDDIFKCTSKIYRLKYGILDGDYQKRLFADISGLVSGAI